MPLRLFHTKIPNAGFQAASTKSRFTNPDPYQRRPTGKEVFRWAVWDKLTGHRRIAPPGLPAPHVAFDRESVRSPDGPPRLTWIGHASFLGQIAGASFLIDPVFSLRIATFYRRHAPPGLLPADLPPLDAVLITHSHYDHLDAASHKALPADVPVVVPLGLGTWFRRRGRERVTELGWWESVEWERMKVTLVPARHWSRRTLVDTNRSLWGGYVIEAGSTAVYHAGDSAWFEGFAEIGRRFPQLLAAMLPIGAYAPAWFMERNHVNPEQAGEAFLATGARHFIPMHWGTFQLTDEPLSEPIGRLKAWWQNHAPADERQLRVAAVGETIRLDE